MQARIHSWFLFAATFLVSASWSHGLSLLDRSPFIWPDFKANEPAQAQQPAGRPSDLEFHAIYELSGNTKVLVKNRRTNEFYWLSLGEEEEGMLPKQYNREKDELLMAYDNQEKWLALQALPQASGKPVATAQPGRTNPAVQNTQNTARRRVIRPTNRSRASSSSNRTVIRPASRTDSRVPRPPRVSSRRPVTGDPPVAQPPSFVPPEPLGDPQTESPDFLPSLPDGLTPPPKP